MRWATERRPFVDRCASAWFVRRFVDPRGTFLFLDAGGRVPRGAVPFDLPGAELGHHGGKVTFDAFLSRYAARCPRGDRGLRRMADLVRDVDLGSFRLPESRGLEASLLGLLLAEPDDRRVVELARPIFEGFYQFFRSESRTRR